MASYDEMREQILPLLKESDVFFIFSDLGEKLMTPEQRTELIEWRHDLRMLIHNLQEDNNDITIPPEPAWLDDLKRSYWLPSI